MAAVPMDMHAQKWRSKLLALFWFIELSSLLLDDASLEHREHSRAESVSDAQHAPRGVPLAEINGSPDTLKP